jgi:serine/threonine protein kinase
VTHFQTGVIIDSYRIVGTLGSGGTGQVYRVEHTLTRRQDAMKVLAGGRQAAGGQAQRFLREIQLQASLNHPNIAAVHHAFWMDDDLIMIMELVEGVTLQSVLQAGRLPLASAFNYAKQVLVALQYAHEHGVMHRDVTPSNIMIALDGTVKLTDFGLAKAPRDMRLTHSGAVMGSLYYMSPEQVRGSIALDERTDIYSLGAVLYEMSTGTRPFEADDPFSIMLAHVQQEPVSPLQIDPSLPPELNQVLLTALAKEPDRRFSSANAFREALERLPKIVSTNRVQRWPQSKVARYSVSALVCATLLISVKRQKLSEAPAAAPEERPVLRAPYIRTESADDGSVPPLMTTVHENSGAEEGPAMQTPDMPEESADDGGITPRATPVRKKSAAKRLGLPMRDIHKESADGRSVPQLAKDVREFATKEHPVLHTPDVRKESTDDGSVPLLATDVREKSAGDERPLPRTPDIGKESANVKPTHRRFWLWRGLGKVVHPLTKQNCEPKR